LHSDDQCLGTIAVTAGAKKGSVIGTGPGGKGASSISCWTTTATKKSGYEWEGGRHGGQEVGAYAGGNEKSAAGIFRGFCCGPPYPPLCVWIPTTAGKNKTPGPQAPGAPSWGPYANGAKKPLGRFPLHAASRNPVRPDVERGAPRRGLGVVLTRLYVCGGALPAQNRGGAPSGGRAGLRGKGHPQRGGPPPGPYTLARGGDSSNGYGSGPKTDRHW